MQTAPIKQEVEEISWKDKPVDVEKIKEFMS